jgi:hypothetical protein
MRLGVKIQLMDNLFKQFTGSVDPENEVVQDISTLDILQVILIIQINDRGRQSRLRIMIILKKLKNNYMNKKL